MKKKSIDLKKKLILNKETLAQLNQQEQANIVGGDGTVRTCYTIKSCPNQNTGFASCEGSC